MERRALRQRKEGETRREGDAPSQPRRRNYVRVFQDQKSLIDQLTEKDSKFQALYDVMMVQVILFMVFVLLRDSYKAGRLHFDITLMYIGLGSPKTIAIVLCAEACLLAGAFLVHPSLLLWKSLRSRTTPLPVDLAFILLYACYVLGSGAAVVWLVFNVPFPPYTTIVATIEQLRLSLKSYSFVRENAYKVLYPWSKEDKSGPVVWYGGQMDPRVGSFSQYLYFLFAPTLLYRDHYPRSPGPINWKYVTVYFLQFLTTIWYISVIYRDFLFPASFHRDELIQCFLRCLLCGFLMLLIVHTCVLHAYMNFICEIFKFADRTFYSDWWGSTSFSSYYRKWNLLVHDWIHAYLYVDMKALFKHPLPAIFATILMSAFVHEYLLAMALGFASPILVLEFAGLGVVFYLMRPCASKRVSNLFVLWMLSVGGANLLFYYQVEFAARLFCPKELTWANFFIPRMAECYSRFNS